LHAFAGVPHSAIKTLSFCTWSPLEYAAIAERSRIVGVQNSRGFDFSACASGSGGAENLGDSWQGFERVERAARSKLLVMVRDGVKSSRFVCSRGRCAAVAPGNRLSGRVVIELSKNNRSLPGTGERATLDAADGVGSLEPGEYGVSGDRRTGDSA
jgi:hypothetical protein